MRRVMITGSFDPVTVGHEDIIRRASSLFDDVRVTVFINPEKPGMFSADTRVSFLKSVAQKYPNVSVDFDSGMVIDYVKRENIAMIVRAVRDEKDLAYEIKMADFNRENSGVETLLLTADPALSEISSTEVRRRITSGEAFFALVPAEIHEEIAIFAKNFTAKSIF